MAEALRGDILLYRREDGESAIEVRREGDTVCLGQQQIADHFQTSRTNLVARIGNIHTEGELAEEASSRRSRQLRTEGSSRVTREVPQYNLDLIISLGFRLKRLNSCLLPQMGDGTSMRVTSQGFDYE